MNKAATRIESLTGRRRRRSSPAAIPAKRASARPWPAVGSRGETETLRDQGSVFGLEAARGGGPFLYRRCACGGDPGPGGECDACRTKREAIQRSVGPAAAARAPAEPPAIVYDALRSGGQALAAADRGFFESRMGHDFAGVRVHTGALAGRSADAVDAHAYSVGRDIVFAASRYAPGTSAGRKLLAHELVHVLQQGQTGGAEGPSRGLELADPSGAAELEAARLASRVADGPPLAVGMPRTSTSLAGRGVIHRTPAPPNYGGVTGVRDLGRISIDPVPDFVTGVIMVRAVSPHVNDAAVTHLTWELYDPSDQMMSRSFSTVPGSTNATTRPFVLASNDFSGAGFVPGKYLLRCVGLNASHQPVVYADRDFSVLSADLTTYVPLPTTYGMLTFARYDKTDANPPASRSYKIGVTLQFVPAGTVPCDDVTFIQSVLSIDNRGRSLQHTANPETDARKTPLAWSIDRIAGAPSPFYIAGKDPDTGVVYDAGGWGHKGHGGATPEAATLVDDPAWNQTNNAKFESCAICRSGGNRGQVYGCATWGYTATADGKVTLMPRSFRQTPSDQFEEARASWNAWRTSRPAADRPEEAPVLRNP